MKFLFLKMKMRNQPQLDYRHLNNYFLFILNIKVAYFLSINFYFKGNTKMS